MTGEKIGLLGGTFNPVHSGHLQAAKQVQEKFRLQTILFIPSYIPPHKQTSDMASPRDRFAMVRLAVAGHPGFVASPIEIRARQKSYSIITLNEVRRIYPGARVFFILGVDAFLEIQTWMSYREVLEKCRFIVVRRPGYRLSGAKKVVPGEFRDKIVAIRRSAEVNGQTIGAYRFFLVDIRALPVSSTEIRCRIRQGRSIKGLVPEAVEDFIRKKKLYRLQRSNDKRKSPKTL